MQTRFYRPELDALRFVAFALVFANHGFPSEAGFHLAGIPAWISGPVIGLKRGGAFGVDLFFLLSSYLITEILLREHRATSSINVPAFWARRILRIWPLYFAFLGLSLWIVPLLLEQTFPPFHALAFATFWGNFAIILAPSQMISVAQLLWSVSIEEQFYLLWPLVLLLFKPRLEAICVSLIVVSTVVRAYLVSTGVDSTWSLWGNTVTRLEPIAVGALIAIRLKGGMPELRSGTRYASMLGGLLIVVFCGMYLSLDGPSAMIAYPLATAAATLMLIGILGTPWTIPAAFIYLGRISYGLYVFHVFAITASQKYIVLDHGFAEWAVEFTAAFAITVLLAACSYRWYETPFLQLKARFSHDPKPEVVAA